MIMTFCVTKLALLLSSTILVYHVTNHVSYKLSVVTKGSYSREMCCQLVLACPNGLWGITSRLHNVLITAIKACVITDN